VSPKGITNGHKKLKVVREWPTTKNKHEMRSVLDICAYYGRFISGFANIAKPLTKLTEKQAFQWTPAMEATFQTLKEALCTAPILPYLQPREIPN
jgi:hypothetical protein